MPDAQDQDIVRADTVENDVRRNGYASDSRAKLRPKSVAFGRIGKALAALDQLEDKSRRGFRLVRRYIVADLLDVPGG